MIEKSGTRPQGRPRAPEYVCRTCPETNPAAFGVNTRKCLSCRAEETRMKRVAIDRQKRWGAALAVLGLINSFPPVG